MAKMNKGGLYDGAGSESEGRWVTINGAHVHIEDGQSVEDALKARGEQRQNADYADIVGAERKKGAKTSIPVAQSFDKSWTSQHMRHAKAMGLNEKEYKKAAVTFFNSDAGDLYYEPNADAVIRYDAKTDQVCVVGKDGNIFTFYRFDTKKGFERIKKQRGYHKI